MFNRSFLLSLGITTLSAAFLFIYFKNRINDVENKVQLIFDLVQSHQNNVNQQQYNSGLTVELKNETPQGMNPVVESSKIDISEDESSEDESDESDDSDDSDNERENENTPENMDGQSDDEKVPDLVDASEDLEVETFPHLEKESNNDTDVNVENIQDLSEFTLDNVLEESMSLTNNLDEDSLDELSSLDENTIEEQVEKPEEPPQDLKKLTVATLKTLAEKKGLTNYKSLKKAALIKLIQEN